MFFQENIDAILKHNPWQQAFADKLKETAPATGAELFPASDGNYTLRYKNVFLHDQNSPVREAQEAIKPITTIRPDKIQLIMGIGLGYVLQELFESSQGKIVVYEPDLAFLRFILENVGLTEYLDSGRVWLASDMQELEVAVRRHTIGDFQVDVVGLKSAAILYGDLLPELNEQLNKWFKVSTMDSVTIKRFFLPWVEEMLKNYASFADMRNVDELFERFENKPALLISSGPSLDHAIDAVKAMADSTVLVAVGGALRRLHQAGVAPDFALFYDVLGMKEQFHGLPQEYLDKIIFVMCPFSQHECFEAPIRAKMLFHSNNILHVINWLEKTLDEPRKRLPGGATVSLIGFQLAHAMKCNPITLIGQDLAFPNNQVYAGGIMMQKDAHGNLTLQGDENLYAEAAPMSEVMGQNGEMLPTLATYALFLKAFEEMAEWVKKENPQIRLYNASVGGAAIEGYTVKPLFELVGQAPPPWKTPFAINGEMGYSPAEVQKRRALLKNGLAEFKTGVLKSISICKRMQRDLPGTRPRQLSAGKTDKQIKAMRELNKQYNEVLVTHPLVEFLMTMETFDYKQSFMNKLEDDDVIAVWYQAIRTLLTNSLKILGGSILPKIEQAEKALEEADNKALTTAG